MDEAVISVPEPSTVIEVKPGKDVPVSIDTPTCFRYYCRILFWIFRIYGVNLSSSPKTLCDLASYTILLAMNLFLLAILSFHIHVLINAMYNDDYIMLYAIIPIILAIIRPIVAYVTLLRRRRKLEDFFGTIVRKLLIDLGRSPGELRNQIRKWELVLVIIFVACYVTGFTVHIFIHSTLTEDDPFHQAFANLTNIPVERPILLLIYWTSVHAFMLELVTISTFVVICLLLASVFKQLQAGTQCPKQGDDPQSGNDRTFWKMHQQICTLVETGNTLFTQFLTMSLVIQIFTICFWTRGLAFDSPWMTFHYHLWVVHFLILVILSFVLLCWAASQVNQQVYLSLRALDDHADFTYPDPNYATIKHLYYITNLNINPIQITFWNSFAINKSFVITVIGTIVTYTVALFGLN